MASSTIAHRKNNNKIIFKCDQFAAIISEKLFTFYKESEFFDTVLIAGSNYFSIQAHRIVLCAFSEYFLDVFRVGQSVLKGNVIELKNIEASVLKLIIDFMYSGSIETTLGTIGILLRTASFLKMKSLVDGCCELIEPNIDSNNCLNWLRLAYELNLPKLKAKSLEYTCSHFCTILKENQLLMLSETELRDLLSNDNSHGDFEEEVFNAIVAWINYDKLNREHLVCQLLSKIHFQTLTPKFIVGNMNLICNTVESYELCRSWLEWHLSTNTVGFNDYYLLAQRKKLHFPSNIQNRDYSLKALVRFYDFYFTGTICAEDNLYATIFDMIGNARTSSGYIFEPGQVETTFYDRNISPNTELSTLELGAKVEIFIDRKSTVDYSLESSQMFRNYVGDVIKSINTAKSATPDEIKLYRLTGFLAMSLCRATISDSTQMGMAFSRIQYKKNLVNVVEWPAESPFAPPCKSCISDCISGFKPGISATCNVFTLLAGEFVTTLSPNNSDKNIQNYLSASVLTHTARYGLELLEMADQACTILKNSLDDLLKMIFDDRTKSACIVISNFYGQFSKNKPQNGFRWARLIDSGFFRGLAPEEHPFLATILASIIEQAQGKVNSISSKWSKICPNQEDANKIGITLYYRSLT